MSTVVFGGEITRVDATAEYPLGFKVRLPAQGPSGARPDQGEQVWIYVFNDEAATAFAQGTVVARDLATLTYDAVRTPLSGPSARVVGVAQHAIAFGSFGFVLKQGLGEVIADTGGITADTALVPGSAVLGTADDAAAVTDDAFGYSTETVLATALATCYIDCRG
jgi:hypothetical protein